MKDCTTCKYGFVDERLGIPMCHHPLRFSKDCVDFNMHEEKEESKKTIGIVEKKRPDELEEAAYKYTNSKAAKSVGRAWLQRDVRLSFIAGAEWGINQCPLPEDTTIFLKGVAEGRRLEKNDNISLIESRIGEILGDAQPAPVLRAELRELINKIKEGAE